MNKVIDFIANVICYIVIGVTTLVVGLVIVLITGLGEFAIDKMVELL